MHPCRSMECIWAKRRASGSSDAAWAVTAYQLMRGEVAGSLDSLLDICQWRHGQPYRTFKALVSEINRRLLFWKGVYIEIISRIYLTPQVFYFGLFHFKCIHAVVLPFPIDELLTFFAFGNHQHPFAMNMAMHQSTHNAHLTVQLLENNHSGATMTSSNGSIFRVTDSLCGEFTGHRWIPLTKASDAELWCFLWSVPE